VHALHRDRLFAKYAQSVGCCRSPGDTASGESASIGLCRSLLWSGLVVSTNRASTGVCNPGAEPSDAHLLRAACALHQILTPQTPSCQPHHPLTLAAVIVTVGAGESSASIGVSRSTKQ
jgi:hypothetical protein